jgi:hypothetical protein
MASVAMRIPVGAILEADGRRDARPVRGAPGFRRARTNRAQIRSAMYCGEITGIRCQRAGHAVDFDQQLARHAQALVDAEGFVEVGSLISPSAHGGAALQVHAHHD